MIQNLWNNYKGLLWGPYGFRDAFNLTVNPDWYGADVLGIDQGPITIMIENYRTGRVWNRFMQNADVLNGLQLAGFSAVIGVEPAVPVRVALALSVEPNPFVTRAVLRYRLPEAGPVRLTVYDVSGRQVARLGGCGAGRGPRGSRARRRGASQWCLPLPPGSRRPLGRTHAGPAALMAASGSPPPPQSR